MAGYVIFLNGVPVAWSARKLKIVPLSSCEAETAAGCNASKALLFVRSLLNYMGAVVPVPIAMYTDNEATRIAVRNPGATQRTRFFEMWMTALRKLQLERVIDVQWVATTEMIADIFTKPLDKTAFLKHRAWLVFDPRKA